MFVQLFAATSLFVFFCTAEYYIGDYMKTPAGYWHKDCVHGVPSGSRITNEATKIIVKTPNGTVLKHKRCPHGIQNQTEIRAKLGIDARKVNGSGWQVLVKANRNNTHYYQANWKIPIEPTKGGQIIYVFIGLQNIDYHPSHQPNEVYDSIQAVLQYGITPAGGNGDTWGIAGWYSSMNTDIYHSQLLDEWYDDIIWSYLNKTANDSWDIYMLGYTSTMLTVEKSILSSQPWAYTVLSVYDITSCDQYPQISDDCEAYPVCNTIPFYNYHLDAGSNQKKEIPWVKGKTQDPVCGAYIETYTVADPTDDVVITF